MHAAFTGKLCTGEPGVVPVGIYAQESLQNLGWWDSLQGRIVGTDDVRTALAFVERGECPLGIVYATDAKISDKVEVVATLSRSNAQANRLSGCDGAGRSCRRSCIPEVHDGFSRSGSDLHQIRVYEADPVSIRWS